MKRMNAVSVVSPCSWLCEEESAKCDSPKGGLDFPGDACVGVDGVD